jgi:hypothetical protein
MINVNEITTTLRGMPDRLLQQYAMMNKANPYVLSLAVAESNQRKQLRTAAQARNAMPQPKVADAAIASMTEAPAVDAMGNVTGMAGGGLPEDQGIARIPAPNMQRMADGGIAGYGDDDEGMAQGGMFDFAQRSEPVVRMSGGGAVQKFAGKGEQLVRTTDGGKSWWLDIPSASRGKPSVGSELANKKFTSRQEAIAAYEAVAGGGEAPVSTTSAPMATPIVPYGQSKAIDMGGTPPPAPPPAPTTQQGLGSIPIPKTLTPDQAKEQAGQFADFGDARTALRQAELDQETQGARMRTTLSEGLPKTPALQGLEKLLDKQDAETGGEKDKAAGLALLSAGLAIAGGSSPFALQNLKEAIPAVAQYGDALKDIKKMQRENIKMRGDIEVARRAEDSNNLKLKLEVEDKILSRKDKLNDMGINLLAKIADTDTRTATELWKTSQDNASRIQSAVAGARASNMGQIEFLEKLGAASPDSPLRKGYSLKTQEGAEPRLYTEYIKQTEDPINGAAFKQKYPTFEIFKEGYSGSGLQFAAPPASASILKPPKG